MFDVMNSFSQLKGIAKMIDNERVSELVCSFLDQPEFRVALGGETHHMYRGGLVQHTLEVAQIAQGMYCSMGVKQHLSHNLVIAGACLHDIGKIFIAPGLYVKNAGIIHAPIGAHEVYKRAQEYNLRPEQSLQLYKIVMEHAFATEHVKTGFSTAESVIVHLADYASSVVCDSITDLVENGAIENPDFSNMKLATF